MGAHDAISTCLSDNSLAQSRPEIMWIARQSKKSTGDQGELLGA